MTKSTMTVLVTLAVLWSGGTTPAFAQSAASPLTPTFISVSVGVQPQGRNEEGIVSFPLYGEDAVFSGNYPIGTGAFVDIAVGHRVWRNIVGAVAYSYFSSSGDATGTASIPDPLVKFQPAVVPIQGSDLGRSENALHFQALWFRQLSPKIDIGLGGGPSVIWLSQDLLSGTVAPGTQDVTPATESQTGAGFGLNLSADTTYMLTPKLGVGLLLRYTWASVGLDANDMTAGGFQVGGGVRYRLK
jgi:hypothetical protein